MECLSLSSFTKNFCRIFSPFFSPLCQKTAARWRGTGYRDMTRLDFCDYGHDVEYRSAKIVRQLSRVTLPTVGHISIQAPLFLFEEHLASFTAWGQSRELRVMIDIEGPLL
jgi:hypothetical protein